VQIYLLALARKGLIGQTDNDIGGEICGGEVNIIYYIYVGLAKVSSDSSSPPGWRLKTLGGQRGLSLYPALPVDSGVHSECTSGEERPDA
jgi:hypothetical protein